METLDPGTLNAVFATAAGVFFQIGVLAVFIEGMVEFLDNGEENVSQPYLRYIGLGTGVLICVITGVDGFEALGIVPQIPLVGEILTGLVVGRGSNYAHNFFGQRRTNVEAVDVIESKHIGRIHHDLPIE